MSGARRLLPPIISRHLVREFARAFALALATFIAIFIIVAVVIVIVTFIVIMNFIILDEVLFVLFVFIVPTSFRIACLISKTWLQVFFLFICGGCIFTTSFFTVIHLYIVIFFLFLFVHFIIRSVMPIFHLLET